MGFDEVFYNVRSSAALPPDMRKGSAFPWRPFKAKEAMPPIRGVASEIEE